MIDVSHPFFDTNLSWLAFNHRLLLEARDHSVPPLDRLASMGRYSAEVDEFFRLRMPTLYGLRSLSKDLLNKINMYPEPLLEHIYEAIENQLDEFNDALAMELIPELKTAGVYLYFKESYKAEHQDFVRNYFYESVIRHLQPVLLDGRRSQKVIFFQPNALYFIVRLIRKSDPSDVRYAYLNLPTELLGRFVQLPSTKEVQYVTFLDDIVRFCLDQLFVGYEVLDCFALRAQPQASIELGDEYPAPLVQRMNRQLEKIGYATSVNYFCEMGMPAEMRQYLAVRFGMVEADFYERGRYLDYKDLVRFPRVNARLAYSTHPPISHVELGEGVSLFDALLKRDYLLHFPYHATDPVVRLFNEAAVDPFVREIEVSLYKINANSFIINALISAARNGKRVTTYVELNPKLDLKENLDWARRLKESGAKIVFSLPGLKVHAKVALIKRRVKRGWERFGYLGTGGFYKLRDRSTVDHALLTANREITNELELLFGYLKTQEEPQKFKYLPFSSLSVTQFGMVKKIIELIDREIAHAKAGLKASIFIKVNQFQDQSLIKKIYQAGQSGVEVVVFVNESCGVIPDLPTISDRIVVKRLVDRYFDNTRILYFYNRGKEDIYLSSGDLSFRNLYRRIDVMFPISDYHLKKELLRVMANYMADNQKAAILNTYQHNQLPAPADEVPLIRAQEANYRLVTKLVHRTPGLFGE